MTQESTKPLITMETSCHDQLIGKEIEPLNGMDNNFGNKLLANEKKEKKEKKNGNNYSNVNGDDTIKNDKHDRNIDINNFNDHKTSLDSNKNDSHSENDDSTESIDNSSHDLVNIIEYLDDNADDLMKNIEMSSSNESNFDEERNDIEDGMNMDRNVDMIVENENVNNDAQSSKQISEASYGNNIQNEYHQAQKSSIEMNCNKNEELASKSSTLSSKSKANAFNLSHMNRNVKKTKHEISTNMRQNKSQSHRKRKLTKSQSSSPHSHTSTQDQVEKVILRTVLTPQDVESLQEVHAELFPVPYSTNFFHNLVRHPKIYTCVATTVVNNQEKIIGVCSCRVQEDRHYDWINSLSEGIILLLSYLCCCFAPLFSIMNRSVPQNLKDKNLPRHRQSADGSYCIRTGYIMTLGVKKHYRRRGLASEMLKIVMKKMKKSFHCHQLMLHCKTDNIGALEFYKKVFGFKIERKISNYYNIDNQLEDAYQLVLKIQDGPLGSPPRSIIASAITKLVSMFSIL